MRPIAISWAVVAFIAAVSSAVAASYENSHGQISDQLTVDHAQIVLSPEGRTAVGYLAVWNGTRHGANLVSVQSEAFGSILFHRTEVVDGIGYMRPIKGALLLPGHSELLMKPGGVHMMLSDPKSTLTAGDNVTLVLTFDDGARVETAAKLLATGERTVDHHHAEGDMVESE